MDDILVEPVPHQKQASAVRFIVGGQRRDGLTQAQAQILLDGTLLQHPERTTLWWALHKRRCVAAAMVFENVGRTGMLFASPAGAEGVDVHACSRVAGGLAGQMTRGRLSMVQALLPPDRQGDMDMLKGAGLVELAELIYMRRPLAGAIEPNGPGLEWLDYSQYDDLRLERIIEATYADSLDCPAMEGLRRMDDVIEGHKYSGVFSPRTWWIVRRDGADAGCILVNDVPSSVTADVVYMGVAPEHRGKGLGRAMLRRAAGEARRRGSIAMSLAVDSRNKPAIALYASEGFTEVDRRVAMAMLGAPARPVAAARVAAAPPDTEDGVGQ